MVLALIVAAGSGERLGADRPKALVELAGRSLLQWSVDLMLAVEGIERIVVALPSGVSAPAGTIGIEGGAVRSQSVARALQAAGPGDPEDLVVVHDAARPLASTELVRRSLAALADAGSTSLDAAIAAAPVADTIKRVRGVPGVRRGDGADLAPGEVGVVVETLDRSALWAVQTPQVFRRAVLERALNVSGEVLAQATDDAWLVERLGGRVAVVPADGENLKITTPLDLSLAELLVASA
ncbi:MAG TPA: 2-C-methyl-D-erythritol 4-phosphate cytidylyltransferase [Solirubrobacteraceae bacterium]|jgi:2-C-methyl-D-erythritol 4-phosphate cytidylyltransferase|nr:2-C-methyl-D-erythritol 4-phosphate cytidylyltransferase [Solirubrobacteraceae bacterium]